MTRPDRRRAPRPISDRPGAIDRPRTRPRLRLLPRTSVTVDDALLNDPPPQRDHHDADADTATWAGSGILRPSPARYASDTPPAAPIGARRSSEPLEGVRQNESRSSKARRVVWGMVTMLIVFNDNAAIGAVLHVLRRYRRPSTRGWWCPMRRLAFARTAVPRALEQPDDGCESPVQEAVHVGGMQDARIHIRPTPAAECRRVHFEHRSASKSGTRTHQVVRVGMSRSRSSGTRRAAGEKRFRLA